MQSSIYVGSNKWNPSASKRQHFFSQCGGKVGPNIKWFVPTLPVIFCTFCFGRDMQISKGAISQLSWERWDQQSCLMRKHCNLKKNFFFFFKCRGRSKCTGYRTAVTYTNTTIDCSHVVTLRLVAWLPWELSGLRFIKCWSILTLTEPSFLPPLPLFEKLLHSSSWREGA